MQVKLVEAGVEGVQAGRPGVWVCSVMGTGGGYGGGGTGGIGGEGGESQRGGGQQLRVAVSGAVGVLQYAVGVARTGSGIVDVVVDALQHEVVGGGGGTPWRKKKRGSGGRGGAGGPALEVPPGGRQERGEGVGGDQNSRGGRDGRGEVEGGMVGGLRPWRRAGGGHQRQAVGKDEATVDGSLGILHGFGLHYLILSSMVQSGHFTTTYGTHTVYSSSSWVFLLLLLQLLPVSVIVV